MNAIEQIFGTNTVDLASTPQKELGQEDFLKLLVAQLKNQDPNNPADNGEFLGQIAQFSMVSGIDDLGVSFDSIAGSLFTSQAMQATQLVGREVLIETDTGVLTEGKTVEGVLAIGADVTEVRLRIHDESGSLVRTIDLENLDSGLHDFNWDGLDEELNEMESGKYVVSAEGLVNGELEGIPLLIFRKVDSVSVDRINTNVVLHLDDETSVGLSHISQYR